MAKSANNKILVSVDMKQKDTMDMGGIKVSTALSFEVNYREKSPVIAKVEQGNEYLKTGEIIITHHNNFYYPSPYYLYDNLYSIPANHTIFAVLKPSGELEAVYGNILGERVDIESFLPLPPEQRQKYDDRIIVTDNGKTVYEAGQMVFTTKSAPYDIVYNFGGEVKRITKVNTQFVVGVAIPDINS